MPAGVRSDHFPSEKNNQPELQRACARTHTHGTENLKSLQTPNLFLCILIASGSVSATRMTGIHYLARLQPGVPSNRGQVWSYSATNKHLRLISRKTAECAVECGVANVGVAARNLFPNHNFERTEQWSDASAPSIKFSTPLGGPLSNLTKQRATCCAKFHFHQHFSPCCRRPLQK